MNTCFLTPAQALALIYRGPPMLTEESGELRTSQICLKKSYAESLAHQPLGTLRRIYDWCDSCDLKDLFCWLHYHGATTAHTLLIL